MKDDCVDLKLNRSLLYPHFDGYKLSSDSLATYQTDCEQEADCVQLSDAQYSYQHVKAYGNHNQLTSDPWHPDTVYYVSNKWRVLTVTMKGTRPVGPDSVYEIPAATEQQHVPDRVNVTLHFPAEQWAVLCDGAGKLHLLNTGIRDQPRQWTTRHSADILGAAMPFAVRHSRCVSSDSGLVLHCVLVHVARHHDDARDEEDGGPVDSDAAHMQFVTVIEWLTFTSDSGEKWELSRTQRLEGATAADFLSLDENGSALYVSSEKPFKSVYDSCEPEVTSEVKPQETSEKVISEPTYTWSQTSEDVSVQFTVPPDTQAHQVTFTLTSSHLEVGCQPDIVFLRGPLHAVVDVDSSTWTLTDHNRLDVHLEKSVAGQTWSEVVVGDTRGQRVVDPEEVDKIHERLAHLTAPHWNADPTGDQKTPYNVQQLEECDSYPDEASSLCRWHSLTLSHKVNLGSHQWLFNAPEVPDLPIALCLRHDVDGIVWQPLGDTDSLPVGSEAPFTHAATFNAFGYVQASKQQRKFTCCAPNYSFVAICDSVRHVFVYRQPSVIDTDLRNRKTGRKVESVAKQQLASLESVESITGFRASNEWIFVLSGKKFYAIRVNAE